MQVDRQCEHCHRASPEVNSNDVRRLVDALIAELCEVCMHRRRYRLKLQLRLQKKEALVK